MNKVEKRLAEEIEKLSPKMSFIKEKYDNRLINLQQAQTTLDAEKNLWLRRINSLSPRDQQLKIKLDGIYAPIRSYLDLQEEIRD
ncbi:hypothetical protein K9L16_02945 [Candidatus Pacearchaeota archaeon]|nr:hypothetical protein [Candidatus Pacearchaeota archaeon]